MASSSQGLLSTYRKYKVDTDTVAGWLVTQATKHGFKFGNRERSSIRTSDILPMAQFVAVSFKKGGKGQFVLSPVVDAAFRHAISARKRVTAWYETKSDGQNDVDSNARHHYFTNILLKAWNVLLDAATPLAKNSKSSSKLMSQGPSRTLTSVSANAVFSNKFIALTLEDIEDDGEEAVLENSPSTSKVKKPKTTPSFALPDVTIDEDDQQVEEEFWFAIQSFLMELHKVRDAVLVYWQDYKAGISDLIMAAMGTRTAIDLIRRAEIELGLRITRPSRFPEDKYPAWKLPALLYAREHSTDDQDLDAFVDVDIDKFTTVPNGENDFCLYNIYVLLSCHYQCAAWRARTGRREIWPICKPGQVPDVIQLDTTISRLRFLVKPEWPAIPWEDEISRGLRHVLKEGEIVIWAMFAFRVLSDIHSLGETNFAFRDIFEDVSHVIDSSPFTVSQLQFSKWGFGADASDDLADDKYADGMEPFEYTLARAGSWVLGDKPFHDLDPHEQNLVWPSWFLESNPLHCGLIKYDLYRSRQWATYRVNRRGTSDLWTMMHVYVAGRIAYKDSSAWSDLEMLIHQQDVHQVFIGGRPRSLPESAKKWLLAQGNTISEINRRDWEFLRSSAYQGYIDSNRWRPLGDSSVLGNFFQNRLHACSVHCLETHDNFKAQIRKMHSKPALSRLATQLNIDKHERFEFVDKWEKRLHSWTISEILELTQKYLSVDLADVGFNWQGLNDTCASIWEKVAPLMREGSILKNTKRKPINWTTAILCDAAEAERVARKKKTSLEAELTESVPAFSKLWELIQELTVKKHRQPLYDGRRCYGGERSLCELLLMNGGVSHFPGQVVVPHLHSFFAGWPAKRGMAKVLADRSSADKKMKAMEKKSLKALCRCSDFQILAPNTPVPETTAPKTDLPNSKTTASKSSVRTTAASQATPYKKITEDDEFQALLKAAGAKFWASGRSDKAGS